jgi:hypothetical protein
MAIYKQLEQRINQILGDEAPLSFDRIFLALNKFLALKDKRTPLLSPFGNIYFLEEIKLYEEEYDIDNEKIIISNKTPEE